MEMDKEKDSFFWLEKMLAFEEIVFRFLKANPRMAMDAAIEEAAKSPAPRFYVSLPNAKRYVSKIDRGVETGLKNKNKIAMYEELHRRFCKRREEMLEAHRAVVGYAALEEIYVEPAPSFYEDIETLRCALYRLWRMRKNKNNIK